MLKSPLYYENQLLYTTEQKEYTEKIKQKHKTYIPKDTIHIDKQENEDLEEEEEKVSTNVEKIKIYRSKKNTSKMKEKPIKKLYHNEINNTKGNNEVRTQKSKSKSKFKVNIKKLNLNNQNQTLDSKCTTDRVLEKNEDLRCNTMATTPKKKFKKYSFKNISSLGRDKKSFQNQTEQNFIPFMENNYYNKLLYHRNKIKSNDFKELFSEEYSNLHLTHQDGENDLIVKYLGESNIMCKENHKPKNLKKNYSNKLFEKDLKTQKEKSFNDSLVKDIINKTEFNNNKSNLRNLSQKGSYKNIKRIQFLSNQNNINKEMKPKYNLSQKNLFTPKKTNTLRHTRSLNSYKPLSKPKQNNNIIKPINFPKSSLKKTNFSLNSTFGTPFKRDNFKKKLFNESATNKYLAPITESNIAIENENCHFLENTISVKNKIVKKVKNIYGAQTTENSATLKKIKNIIENNEKKNNKNSDKTKNEKEKNKLNEANKNAKKLTFSNAVSKLYKKNVKKPEIKVKKENNIKLQKNNNINNILDMTLRNKNNNLKDMTQKNKNNNFSNILNISKRNNDNNNDNIQDITQRYKNIDNNLNISQQFKDNKNNRNIQNYEARTNNHNVSQKFKNNKKNNIDISQRYKDNRNKSIHNLSQRNIEDKNIYSSQKNKNNNNINNNNIHDISKEYKINSNNIHNMSQRYKININNNILNMTQRSKKNKIIPDMNQSNRGRSINNKNLTRCESIDISKRNICKISKNNLFNGKIEDYLITKELGRGSYAVVKLAMHKISKERYAIKIYTKESLLDPQKRNTVKNEVNILNQLNHNNIMKLYEVIDSSKYLYLVLEYIKGISLLEVMREEKRHYLEQNRAIKIFLQVVKGVSYCQSKDINHRDIKLENILVLEDDTIKLIDFGFAVKANKQTYQKLFCGTPSYMPPEIVNREKYIAQYSDIWSLGVLLFTMLYGRFPFRARDDETLFKLINEGNLVFPEYISVDEYIKNLIKKIINVNPLLRPTPEQIISEIIFNE